MKSSKSFFTFAAFLMTLQQGVIHAFAQPSIPRDSTWITNGAVTAVAYSKGLTYIGGDFTYVGPHTGYGAALSTTTGAPTLTAVNQFKSDVTTVISEGGTTSENKVVFKGTISDPDGEQVKLQIELRKIAEAFPGVPTLQSGLLSNGAQATLTSDSLGAESYKWRFRAMDEKGFVSPWGNLGNPGNTDFVVNRPPNTPSLINQFTSNGATIIPEGGAANESKVVFKAMITDPDNDRVKLQIELRKITEAFTGSPTQESNLTNSGIFVSVMSDTLAGVGYRWRYRVMDALGLANDWVEFGTPGNTDFVGNGVPTLTGVNQFKLDGTTVIPIGGRTTERKVIFKATISDPEGEQVKLQIELRIVLNQDFEGVPTLESGWINSGAQATIISPDLFLANHMWRYRAMDARGRVSAWMDWGPPTNIDFIVDNNAPTVAAVNQFKSDATTVIPIGGTTTENKVVFKGTVSDPDSDRVILQIELRRLYDNFVGDPNLISVATQSGAQAIVISDILAKGNYKWRYRVMDVYFKKSAWTDWGAPGNTDFVINSVPLPAAAAYGNIPGEDQSHPNEVTYSFSGKAGHLHLSFQAYDINTSDEVKIFLNDNQIANAPLTANNQWSENLGVVLPDALVNNATPNLVVFDNIKNPPEVLQWGVRQVSIENCFQLPSTVAYGKIPGGDQTHADRVIYWFPGKPGEVNLFYEAYDISDTDELDIIFNGAQIRNEAITAINGWSTIRTLLLPEALVNDTDANIVIFDNTKNPPNALNWGVRNVSIAFVAAVTTEETVSPARFHLAQNFPNPFNPTTTIRFSTPSAGRVRLNIYNLYGEVVRTLVNDEMAAGDHLATFDGSDLASGIYFGRLEAGNLVATQKMILAK